MIALKDARCKMFIFLNIKMVKKNVIFLDFPSEELYYFPPCLSGEDIILQAQYP